MKNKFNYFLTRGSFFGAGYYLLIENTDKDSWIAIILGIILGIIVLYIYNNLKVSLNNKTLIETLDKYKFTKLYKIIFIIFYAYLITACLTILTMFISSFYLFTTPKIFLELGIIIIVYYLTSKEKYVLESLSNLLYFLSIFIILIYFLLIFKYLKVTNILPIFTTSNINLIKSTLIFTAITAIPQISTIDYYDNFKDIIKEYLISSITIFVIFFTVILGLGNLISMYSFPEYVVLKQIKLFNFIENIENISSMIWYMDLFIMLSVSSRNILNVLPKNKISNITLLIILLIIVYISSFIIGRDYKIILILTNSYPLVLGIFFCLFLILTIYLRIKNKQS